jgi:hypothetical protein
MGKAPGEYNWWPCTYYTPVRQIAYSTVMADIFVTGMLYAVLEVYQMALVRATVKQHYLLSTTASRQVLCSSNCSM